MKKFIALALTAVLAVSSLAACGNDKEENPKTDATVNQPQSNDPTDNNSSADPNLPRVWRTARRGTYENGVWANAGLRYERNAYGLYTAINVYDEDGNKTGDNATITESYDDQDRLTVFSNGHRSYYFTYDASGKMTEIRVQNEMNRDLVKLTYSADGGYCAVTYDAKYTNTYATSVYDEDLKRISYETVRLGEVDSSKTFTYNSDGLLATETCADYQVEYSYDSDGRLIKQVKTETITADNAWSEEYTVTYEYIDEYSYSAAGNLLTHTGTKFRSTSMDGGSSPVEIEVYDSEVYTDDDYDEQGECLYYYQKAKNTWTGEYTFEKKAYDVKRTYEYADEGWLLRVNKSDGSFTEYDKDENVVAEKIGETYSYGYQAYPIIDDALLLTFYQLYGDEFV